VQRFRAQLQTKPPHDNRSHRSRRRQSTTTSPKSHRKFTPKETQRETQTQRRGAPSEVLTRCISAKVQTRVHNFQPEEDPKTQCDLGAGELCRRIGCWRRGEGVSKRVSRGASRRRCKHECTTSSRRRPKTQCLRRWPIVGGWTSGGTAKRVQDCEADVASRRS